MLSFVFMAALALATDCNSAKNSLDDFLSTLPRSCRVDADCTGRYYRANSCAAPVVTNKAPLLLSKEKQLLALQTQVRYECRAQQPGPASHGPTRISAPVPARRLDCPANRPGTDISTTGPRAD